MSVSEKLMTFRAGINSSDPDIALVLKMAAAIIEQFEKGGPPEDRDDLMTFTLEEYLCLPDRFELISGHLEFQCQRWDA